MLSAAATVAHLAEHRTRLAGSIPSRKSWGPSGLNNINNNNNNNNNAATLDNNNNNSNNNNNTFL